MLYLNNIPKFYIFITKIWVIKLRIFYKCSIIHFINYVLKFVEYNALNSSNDQVTDKEW